MRQVNNFGREPLQQPPVRFGVERLAGLVEIRVEEQMLRSEVLQRPEVAANLTSRAVTRQPAVIRQWMVG